MFNILGFSKATACKILQKMQLSCFSCGWNEAPCDIHHIVPTSKGGTDDANNLTYVCPNCHRLAHRGKLTAFKTFEEMIGDSWQKFAPRSRPKGRSGRPRGSVKKRPPLSEGGNLSGFIKSRYRTAHERAKDAIHMLKESNIDFQSYGWIQQASEILQVRPQSVVRYLKKYDPDFLVGCFQRKTG